MSSWFRRFLHQQTRRLFARYIRRHGYHPPFVLALALWAFGPIAGGSPGNITKSQTDTTAANWQDQGNVVCGAHVSPSDSLTWDDAASYALGASSLVYEPSDAFTWADSLNLRQSQEVAAADTTVGNWADEFNVVLSGNVSPADSTAANWNDSATVQIGYIVVSGGLKGGYLFEQN